ncbi:MAG: hypothetical protein C4516_09245 [Oxalobacter sp.]|nr:MAG: hypothetical protein C4516_09245 [Oxalobacter sp.]
MPVLLCSFAINNTLAESNMALPSFSNRTPNEIVTNLNHFESSGRVFKALSWLDYAKNHKCVSALEYAALETRLAIEQLIFEQLVVGVGTKLDASEYKKCSGDAGKLAAIIKRLIPKYDLLIEFTKAMAPAGIPITKWDNRKLDAFSGKVSNYLHWSGGLDTTVQSAAWFEKGVPVVEEAAQYIWSGLTTGNTGVMSLDRLEPEIFELWVLYASGSISLDDAVLHANILEPMLQERLAAKSFGARAK